MLLRFGKFWPFFGLLLATLPVMVQASCLEKVRVGRSHSNVVVADSKKALRTIQSNFFGFNLEWVEFQIGLWDAGARRVRPDAVAALSAFPGAVYRFPGGTKANHLVWRDAVGPLNRRAALPYVSWRPPLRADFGIDEYLKFVDEVHGVPWYVANVYGDVAGPISIPRLAEDARALATYMAGRAAEGRGKIMRWELGNELDRGKHKWSPEKIAEAANEVAAGIRAADPGAQFVHLQQEYAAMASSGFTAQRFNRDLRAALAHLSADFAIHVYYDGVPENPSVSSFLGRICEVVDGARSEGQAGRLWVTEHARVPNGFWETTDQKLWPATANVAAAVSMADMLIALSQIPEVQGAFAHSLVGSGSPWPMFNIYGRDRLVPSATLLGMQVLRRGLFPSVLSVQQWSRGRGSENAPYSVRSAVLSDSSRSAFTLWSVNRSNDAQILEFQIDGLQLPVSYADSWQIESVDPTVGNNIVPESIVIKNNHKVEALGRNSWRVVLKANSVNALVFR